jgi:hypothetical protein
LAKEVDGVDFVDGVGSREAHAAGEKRTLCVVAGLLTAPRV